MIDCGVLLDFRARLDCPFTFERHALASILLQRLAIGGKRSFDPRNSNCPYQVVIASDDVERIVIGNPNKCSLLPMLRNGLSG
jgi:hypothetical protein